MAQYGKSIWWIKRDFRLADNAALCEAIASSDSVLPLFVFEPTVLCAPDASIFHLQAQWQALTALRRALERKGVCIQVATGEVTEVLECLYQNDGFDALFSHQETGADVTYQRDLRVQQWCREHRIDWHEPPQNGVIRRLEHRDQRAQIIKQRLFDTAPLPEPSPFNSWQSSLLASDIPAVAALPVAESRCHNDPDALQLVTEEAAHKDLDEFLGSRGYGYSGGISSPNTAFKVGSRLSPHLAWGTISLRTVFHASEALLKEMAGRKDTEAIQWRKSIRAFQSRLHWHDHFVQRLESAPFMEFEAINPAYRFLQYLDDRQALEAWCCAQTGIPLIDACMRCLRCTGFLNFRMRAMLITTACYGLGLSWRSVQDPLAQVFLDYEPGIHLSQVQMQASVVGINTLRVYSPLKQLLDQDPECTFVKRWVPELRPFSAAEIIQYEHRKLGAYPAVIVDLKQNEKFIKDQIYAIRKSETGREASAKVLEEYGSRRPSRGRSKPVKKKQASRKKPVASRQMPLDFD